MSVYNVYTVMSVVKFSSASNDKFLIYLDRKSFKSFILIIYHVDQNQSKRTNKITYICLTCVV